MTADPTTILLDFARLPALAFVVAHCGDGRHPKLVLNEAWHAVVDPRPLAIVCAAVTPTRVWYDPAPFDMYANPDALLLRDSSFVSLVNMPHYWLHPPGSKRNGSDRWLIQNSWRLLFLDIDQFRISLRRVVPLRDLLAHLGIRKQPKEVR